MNKHFINDQIRESSMLVIDEQGNKLGVMSKQQALQEAENRELDLVLLVPKNPKNPNAICKIADYGKMLYAEKIKARQSKKNQTITKVKEIKVRPQIAENDLKWMAKKAIEWLNDNCQIKFKVRAFGRMGAKIETINEAFNKFVALIGPIAKVQSPLKKVTPVLYEATIVKNK